MLLAGAETHLLGRWARSLQEDTVTLPQSTDILRSFSGWQGRRQHAVRRALAHPEQVRSPTCVDGVEDPKRVLPYGPERELRRVGLLGGAIVFSRQTFK